jgi:hypothetical protein
MKKLLYLFLTVLIVACSSEDGGNDVVGDNNDTTSTITFTLREVWKPKVTWDYSNLSYDYDRYICDGQEPTVFPTYDGTDLTGFETFEGSHYSIDTLVIDISAWNEGANPPPTAFDFSITERIDVKSEPRRIGHIEFIGFNEQCRIFLKHELMNPARVEYFSSNLSEDFINLMSYDNSYSEPCHNEQVFFKNDYGEDYYGSTVFQITVPQDDKNSAIEVGDIIQNNGNLGAGWGGQINGGYLILDKQ